MRHKHSLTENYPIASALARLQSIILETIDFNELVKNVVDATLDELGKLNDGYRIIVLSLVDSDHKVIKRISVSQTKEAREALKKIPVPFTELDIPLSAKENLMVQVLKNQKPGLTHKWSDLLAPAISPEYALEVQKIIGIKTSYVYPILVGRKAIGVMIFSLNRNFSAIVERDNFILSQFTNLVGLAVQNARLIESVTDSNKRLKSANRHLKQIDKLKDEFISIASHELRTPITAIKNYLWLALNGKQKFHPDIQHNLSVCLQSTERLLKLVNEILTVSRIESKRIVINNIVFSFIPFLHQVYDELALIAQEKSISFTCPYGKHEIMVEGDRDKLKEVLINIAGNALKFTPEKGTVKLAVKVVEEEVQVIVSDTGPGILEEDMEKLFTKFGKFEHAYKKLANVNGTGLGLYISKQIVDLHGGDITVQSEVNKGTTFIIHLPIKKGGAEK